MPVVEITNDIWLSAPEDRVTLGLLDIRYHLSKEETDAYIGILKEKTGSTTMDWFSHGGRTLVYVKRSELDLIKHIFDVCQGEFFINNLKN
jgi:hypothetical protein